MPPAQAALSAFPKVAKIGRRTGQTFGRVIAEDLEHDIWFADLRREVAVSNLLEIEWEDDNKPFSEPGDSGSVVYLADSFEPVGLLVAGGTLELTDGTKLKRSYACLLSPILASWKLALV
jgi:hypothetical protein